MSLFSDLVKSKKFVVSVLTVILAIGSRFVPELADLNVTELAALLSPLLIYILGQGIADNGKEVAKVQFQRPYRRYPQQSSKEVAKRGKD